MDPIRRILVAIKDYEARTTPALVKGAQLARGLGARLELFHGISAPLYVVSRGRRGPRVVTVTSTVRPF